MLPEFESAHIKELARKYRSISESDILQIHQGHVYGLDAARELLDEFNRLGFTTPFDWIEWSKQLPENWQTDSSLLETADLETLRRLLTTHLRLERIVFGHIDVLFRNGYMDKFINRLETLA